jgi:predicted deacylase
MAASAINEVVIGLTASATIAQYQPVQASGAAATAAGNACGFATVGANSGERVPVCVVGTAIAVAGAAITAGVAVEVGATVTQVVTKSAGIVIGRALTAAAQAGDLIEVLVVGN